MHGEQVAKVIACVNHDANAIASHAANHPDALHFVEDIRTLNLDRLLAHVEVSRKQYPMPNGNEPSSMTIWLAQFILATGDFRKTFSISLISIL